MWTIKIITLTEPYAGIKSVSQLFPSFISDMSNYFLVEGWGGGFGVLCISII